MCQRPDDAALHRRMIPSVQRGVLQTLSTYATAPGDIATLAQWCGPGHEAFLADQMSLLEVLEAVCALAEAAVHSTGRSFRL